MMNSNKISLCDCTLRQGEKSPALSFRETIELCRLLDKMRVDCIELKEINQKKIDSLLIKSVSQAVSFSQIAVPVKLSEEHVHLTWEALKDAKKPRLQVKAPVSSVQMEYLYHLKPDALLRKVTETVTCCAKYTDQIEFIAIDATRSDPELLRSVISSVIQAGVSAVTLCDTAGIMLPGEVKVFFKSLYSDLPELKNVVVGFACADTIYLADACAIASLECGIKEIKASAYNTNSISLRNLVRIIQAKGDSLNIHESIGTEKLQTLTNQIENLCRAGLGHRMITDDNAENAMYGNLTLNAHESKESVKKAIEKLGYDLSEEDHEKVWLRFSALSEKKEQISVKELEAIIATESMQVPPVYSDVQYVINTGSHFGAMSHMKLTFHGKPLEGISAGDGAIDAAFKSIETATGRHYELDDFQIQSITEGREAMGETLIKLRSDGKLFSGRGLSTDIIGSSIMAYINALNKIVYEEEEA